MATSQHSAIRAALKTVFTDAGLDAFAYNPGDNWNGSTAYVYLAEVSATQEFFNVAGDREETLIVTGRIRSEAPGGSDADAKTAEDAALAVLDDLETSLAGDPTLGGAAFQAELSGPTESEVFPVDGKRICLISFDVRVVVHL